MFTSLVVYIMERTNVYNAKAPNGFDSKYKTGQHAL